MITRKTARSAGPGSFGAHGKGPGRPRARRAFTLVEVIVTLVILAILAAIAVPALTGYIDKARDKQYIAQARNDMVALRTLLTEAYAAGEMDGDTWMIYGDQGASDDAKIFFINFMSKYLINDYYGYFRRASALIGEPYDVNEPSRGGSDPSWESWAVAARDSDANAFTADGFVYLYYPEGIYGPEVICVTYKLGHADESTYNDMLNYLNEYGRYDPDAGYEVYRLTNGG
ncbi:MAG: type II secretion system GspH family protein [Clostridiales Family XIII bacterium]|jgi:prepilin-type N-terminal cleavage/methylation domain-containing protein|nr:type II secretion system GspH family protein [Clostridiales Family XIII bacterium]